MSERAVSNMGQAVIHILLAFFSWLGRTQGSSGKLVAIVATLLLASCGGMNLGNIFEGSGPGSGPGGQNQHPGLNAPARVALLLPLSATGQTANIAAAMKQAAELALLESGKSPITLITKDTHGTKSGAALAAQAALDEGAEIILGPLLGNEVVAVTEVAQPRAIPVIAFSSVGAVARPGVYLMSFLPEQEISNLMRYVSRSGIKRVAAMIPNSRYGSVIERAIRKSATIYGVSLAGTERYSRNGQGLSGVARRVVSRITAANPVQGIFIPEGGQNLRAIGTAMAQAGFRPGSARILGTGLWDSPLTAGTPIALGGWYAGVAPQKVAQFEKRFSASYQVRPPRIASLAYDAVSLTIAFARSPAGTRFTAQQITNPEGFNGVNGLFRFRPDGRIERGLAILEAGPNGPRVIAPAPARF